MAQDVTLSGLRNQIITSIFGRRLGLAPGNSSDATAHYLVGFAGARGPITALTTANVTGDLVPPYGYVTFNTSGASTNGCTHNVLTPVPGAEVTVVNLSTLALTLQLNGSSVTTGVTGYANVGAVSTGLSSATAVKLPYPGATVRMVGISTAKWLLFSAWGTSVTTYGTSAV